MKLFDVHCHLQDQALFPDIKNVMERAEAAGVERFVCCGTSSGDWQTVVQLAEQFPQVIPMVGLHPWFVSTGWLKYVQMLEKLLEEHPEAGVGETGLDFQEKCTNRVEQEECFAAHLDLARELNRPVAVHCVRAWGRLVEILRVHPAPRVLLHAFGGAAELIPELVELNCWFSFCGSAANPQSKRVRASAAAVPNGRLLIETDSPDFPLAGCLPPNEPANLAVVVRAIAELRGIAVEKLAALTFTNSEQFFASV